MSTSPKRTLELLDQLEELGFDNDAFWRLHHEREKGLRPTIQKHRQYCEKTGAFRPMDTNELVQLRLEWVLKHYRRFADLAE